MADKKLTRAIQKKIVDGMSARDMFDITPEQGEDGELSPRSGNKYVGAIFDAAAVRMGYGENALDRVGIGDAKYLSELLSEAMSAGSPKASSTERLPASAATGD